MEIPIITIKSSEKDIDLVKLSEILKKLSITDEKLCEDVIECLKNHKNRNEIIDILDKLTTVPGMSATHDNLYWIYCINRDLIQLDSPIWSDPRDYVDDITEFPTKTEKVTFADLEDEYYQLKEMKGHPVSWEAILPFKKSREVLLRYLMANHVIYSFDIGGIYDCPAEKEKEYLDVLPDNFEIEVMRIL